MPSPTPYLSIVAPAYNEEEGIELFVRRCEAEVARLPLPPGATHEILIVDDGSSDRTAERVLAAAAAGAPVELLQLSRNFGHQAALTAGIDAARGEVIVTMDADLQHPPEYLPEMLRAMREGADVVIMAKTTQGGRSAAKNGLARLFYALMGRISDVPIEPDASDFRLITREVADALKECRETHRFLRGLVSWVGFRQCRLGFECAPRARGVPQYTLRKLWRLASAGIFSHSTLALRWPLYLGLPLFLLTGAMIAWYAVVFIGDRDTLPAGWLTLLVVISMFSALLFIAVGMQGAYLSKVFEQTKERPLYVVRRRAMATPSGGTAP